MHCPQQSGTRESARRCCTASRRVSSSKGLLTSASSRAGLCVLLRPPIPVAHILNSACGRRSHLALDDADPDFGINFSVEALRHGGRGPADIPSALHGAPESAEVQGIRCSPWFKSAACVAALPYELHIFLSFEKYSTKSAAVWHGLPPAVAAHSRQPVSVPSPLAALAPIGRRLMRDGARCSHRSRERSWTGSSAWLGSRARTSTPR